MHIFGLMLLIFLTASEAFTDDTPPFTFEQGPAPETVIAGDTFSVSIKVLMAKGHYLYAKNTRLVPPDTPDFVFGPVITGKTVSLKDPEGNPFPVYQNQAVFEMPVRVNRTAKPGPVDLTLTLAYQGCSGTMCYIPQKKNFTVSFSITRAGKEDQGITNAPESNVRQSEPPEKKDDVVQKTAERFGLLGILFLAFIGGILTSLTPCVYPMIPVTISVIGAGSSKSITRGFFLSVVYVLGMSIVYASLGVAAAWSGSLFGSYVSHPAVRITVAVVFAMLGLSMFDVFFIQTPAALSSKINTPVKSGVLGVFLVGIASGAVVSPCVGPLLVGLFVYIATLGSKMYGFFIMWSFSLGLGILFLVIGTLSGVLKTLPKAGEWMEIVKQVMGLVMFAIALYYIMPIIDATLFGILAGAFLVGMGIFIGTTLKPETAPMGRSRLLYAGGILIVTLGVSYVSGVITGHKITFFDAKKTGIVWMDNESEALKLASEKNKPVMIDFSADWCRACKDLEEETFSHQSVIKEAKRFVTLRIDCTEPEAPSVVKMLKKYHVVGLPTLVFIDPDGNILKDKVITEFIPPKDLLDHMKKIN